MTAARTSGDTCGWHQPLARLTARPPAGAALARAHLEYRGARQPAGSQTLSWQNDPAVLRRVRDALAPGGCWR